MSKFVTNGLIKVQSNDGRILSRGTGWALRPDVVVTALHVVGKLRPQLGWMHDAPSEQDATYYFERLGMPKLALKPLCFDAAADVALLECDRPLNDPIAVTLADVYPLQAVWYADGFPGFDTKEWTLSGNIVGVRGDRLQLNVAEGTQVSWQGVSGSALCVDYRVAGLITAETSATNTVWGAAASAIARLLAAYDVSMEAAALLGGRLDWNTDREALLKSLEREARTFPEAGGLRDRVAVIGLPQPQWRLRPDVLEDLKSYGVGPIEDGFGRLARRKLSETALYDPWDEFEDLFSGRYGADRFGGRSEQLQALDEFVETGRGYFYVTGPAGFGKTALLAQWLRCFRARGERPVFHFVGKLHKFLDDTRTEISCLRSMCKQLLDVHQLGGSLPSEIELLRKLYQRLLTLPPAPDERVIVVLDGLDDTLPDWMPGSPMFPKLTEHVKLIFSAGPVANKDWPRDLKLDLDPTCVRVLDRLSSDEVRDALRRSGLAQVMGTSFEAVCKIAFTVTQGDPDYLADVLELLLERSKEGETDLVGVIQGFPERHSDYLRQWWNSAFEDLHKLGFGEAFEDLMGTLAVLRERMSADDLVCVMRRGEIDTLLKYAGRYVEGNSRSGYHLVRPRVIGLVSEQLNDRMNVYRRWAADFCVQWNISTKSASARRYAIRNAVTHLLEQDDFGRAVALLDPGFIAAKWSIDGSYISLLDDLDKLINFAQGHLDNREAVCRAPAFAVMRESARDLMRSLPASLCACWVRLKGRSQITGLLDALPAYRGEARGVLLAVANEILNMTPAGGKGFADPIGAAVREPLHAIANDIVGMFRVEQRGSLDQASAEKALKRTIDDLQHVRSSLEDPLIASLLVKRGIEPGLLKRTIQRAELLCGQIAVGRTEAREPLLAVANEILKMSPVDERGFADRAWAGELVGRVIGFLPLVRTALWKLEAWSEVCGMLAKHTLEPDQLGKIVDQAEAFLEHIAERDADLKAACLAHMAIALLPWNQEASSKFLARAEAVTYNLSSADQAMVYAIAFPAYRALNPHRGDQLAAETTASLETGRGLSRLSGAREPLIDLLAAWASEPATGPAIAVARALAERELANPGSIWRVPPALLLRFGLHDLAWRVLDRYKTHEAEEFTARQLTNCILAAPGETDSIRPRILSLYTEKVAAPDVARALMHAGCWGQALAVVRRLSGRDLPAVIPECLEVALRQPASTERKATVDTLVECLKEAAGEGWTEGAARSALALARAGLPNARALFGLALRRSLSRLPEGDADRIRYLLGIALSSVGGSDKAVALLRDCKSPTACVAGLVAVLEVTRAGSEERKRVTAELKRQLAAVEKDASEAILLARGAGEVLAAADPAEAAALADTIENVGGRSLASLTAAADVRVLLDPHAGPSLTRELVGRVSTGGERPVREDIQAICSVVVRSAAHDRDNARGLVDHLLGWARNLEDGYRGQALSGLVGALAEFDPERAAAVLAEALRTVHSKRKPAATPSANAAEHFIALIGELTGERWPLANQLASLLAGFESAVPKLTESLLVGAFEGVWAWLLAMPTDLDEFEASVKAYLRAVSRLPKDHSPLVEHLLESLPSAMQARLSPHRLSELCRLTSMEFAENGHGQAARWLSQYIQEAEQKRLTIGMIDGCEFYYLLTDRSVVEEALFQKSKPRAAGAMAIMMVRRGWIDEACHSQLEMLKMGNVRYLLLDRTIFLVFTVLALWGIEGATLVVDALREFDDHLISGAGQLDEAYVAADPLRSSPD
jgi:hypothetical protein